MLSPPSLQKQSVSLFAHYESLMYCTQCTCWCKFHHLNAFDKVNFFLLGTNWKALVLLLTQAKKSELLFFETLSTFCRCRSAWKFITVWIINLYSIQHCKKNVKRFHSFLWCHNVKLSCFIIIGKSNTTLKQQ